MPNFTPPVSACPVRRLEIRGGQSQSQRVYESTHPTNSLSVTLETQKIPGSQKIGLVLLAYSGSHRVLSIRLTDLLAPSGETRDVVTIDTAVNQICVSICEQDSHVLIDFEDERNFNVTVCMLQRTGFSIHQRSPRVPDILSRKLDGCASESVDDLGPRLSSLASLPILDTILQYGASPRSSLTLTSSPENTFTTNYEPSRFTPVPSGSRIWPGSPMGSADTASQFTSQVSHNNPYDVFLDRKGLEPCRPRVSSPLRNAVGPGQLSRQMSVPGYGTVYRNRPFLQPPPGFLAGNESSTSLAVPPWSPQPWSQNSSGIFDPAYAAPAANGILPQWTRRDRAVQDFSRLLPRPRNLPFQRKTEKRDRENLGDNDEDQEHDQEISLPQQLKKKQRKASQPAKETLQKPTAKNSRKPASSDEQQNIEDKEPGPTEDEEVRSEEAPISKTAEFRRRLRGGASVFRAQPKSDLMNTQNSDTVQESQVFKKKLAAEAAPRKQAQFKSSVAGTQKAGAPPQSQASKKKAGSQKAAPQKTRASKRKAAPKTADNEKADASPKSQPPNKISTAETTNIQKAVAVQKPQAAKTRSTDKAAPRKKAHLKASPTKIQKPQPAKKKAAPRRTRVSRLFSPVTARETRATIINTYTDVPDTSTRQTIAHRTSTNVTQHRQQQSDAGVLVVTESMLRQVNRLVSGILDQYEADAQFRCHKHAEMQAQFFLDRIAIVRREYWCRQLDEQKCI